MKRAEEDAQQRSLKPHPGGDVARVRLWCNRYAMERDGDHEPRDTTATCSALVYGTSPIDAALETLPTIEDLCDNVRRNAWLRMVYAGGGWTCAELERAALANPHVTGMTVAVRPGWERCESLLYARIVAPDGLVALDLRCSNLIDHPQLQAALAQSTALRYLRLRDCRPDMVAATARVIGSIRGLLYCQVFGDEGVAPSALAECARAHPTLMTLILAGHFGSRAPDACQNTGHPNGCTVMCPNWRTAAGAPLDGPLRGSDCVPYVFGLFGVDDTAIAEAQSTGTAPEDACAVDEFIDALRGVVRGAQMPVILERVVVDAAYVLLERAPAEWRRVARLCLQRRDRCIGAHAQPRWCGLACAALAVAVPFVSAHPELRAAIGWDPDSHLATPDALAMAMHNYAAHLRSDPPRPPVAESDDYGFFVRVIAQSGPAIGASKADLLLRAPVLHAQLGDGGPRTTLYCPMLPRSSLLDQLVFGRPSYFLETQLAGVAEQIVVSDYLGAYTAGAYGVAEYAMLALPRIVDAPAA